MNKFLLLLAAVAALTGGILSLLNSSGIATVSSLKTLDKPTKVTVSGNLESVTLTERHVVLILRDGDFQITAIADRKQWKPSMAPSLLETSNPPSW